MTEKLSKQSSSAQSDEVLRRRWNIDTAHLGSLRNLIESNPDFFKSIGEIAKVRVVIDANFVIRSILQNVQYPERGNTALQELIISTVLEVHAPQWLESEIQENLPNIAQQYSIPVERLHVEWMKYRAFIKWEDNPLLPTDDPALEVDPDDALYIVLARIIGAAGILSQDKHISAMGGRALSLDFVLETRCYARAEVTSVSLRIGGAFIGAAAVVAFIHALKAISRIARNLPPAMNLLILSCGLFILLHPGARKSASKMLSDSFEKILPEWDAIQAALLQSEEKKVEAQYHRERMNSFLDDTSTRK